jgi:hypothetical protein
MFSNSSRSGSSIAGLHAPLPSQYLRSASSGCDVKCCLLAATLATARCLRAAMHCTHATQLTLLFCLSLRLRDVTCSITDPRHLVL